MKKQIKITDYATPMGIARLLGLPQSSIYDALRSGDLAANRLGDGAPVVDIDAARAWGARRKSVGRPKKR